jgi:hypothetical protein
LFAFVKFEIGEDRVEFFLRLLCGLAGFVAFLLESGDLGF